MKWAFRILRRSARRRSCHSAPVLETLEERQVPGDTLGWLSSAGIVVSPQPRQATLQGAIAESLYPTDVPAPGNQQRQNDRVSIVPAVALPPSAASLAPPVSPLVTDLVFSNLNDLYPGDTALRRTLPLPGHPVWTNAGTPDPSAVLPTPHHLADPALFPSDTMSPPSAPQPIQQVAVPVVPVLSASLAGAVRNESAASSLEPAKTQALASAMQPPVQQRLGAPVSLMSSSGASNTGVVPPPGLYVAGTVVRADLSTPSTAIRLSAFAPRVQGNSGSVYVASNPVRDATFTPAIALSSFETIVSPSNSPTGSQDRPTAPATSPATVSPAFETVVQPPGPYGAAMVVRDNFSTPSTPILVGAFAQSSGVVTLAVTNLQVTSVPIRSDHTASPIALMAGGHNRDVGNGSALLSPHWTIALATPAVANGNENGNLGSAQAVGGPPMNAAQRKALALGMRYLNPELTDEAIAQAAGVSRRTLFRWAEYNSLKKAQRGIFNLPRGSKTAEGDIEAWADEE